MMTIRIGSNDAVRWALLGLALLLLPTPALARDPCQPGDADPIPTCQHQVQTPIHYKTLQTQGWAYYCTGDHPYFYGLGQGYIDAYTWDNSCFSVTENEFGDGINKLDVTITNWCLKGEDITLTLACSATPQPGVAPCTLTGNPVADPGCPQSNIRNTCSNSNPPVCIQTYTETCANNVTYFCTMNLGVAYCLQCAPNSSPPPARRASTPASGVLRALSAAR